MKKYIYLFAIILGATIISIPAHAQNDKNQGIIKSALVGLEYSIKAGFFIGGTAPLPLPAEIRAIESYSPTVAIAIEGNVSKSFGKGWGMEFGLRFETKGMKTDARVKNYHMEMIGETEGKMEGAWTGNVKTKFRCSYLTLPILATYKVSPRWKVKLGPYFSYVTERNFSGSAYDGYLRNIDPTGEMVNVDNATYDFSDDLRRFQWGTQLGGEWRAFSHLNIYADLTWGMNSIFKKDFKSVTFDMYPIYANLGFAYVF